MGALVVDVPEDLVFHGLDTTLEDLIQYARRATDFFHGALPILVSASKTISKGTKLSDIINDAQMEGLRPKADKPKAKSATGRSTMQGGIMQSVRVSPATLETIDIDEEDTIDIDTDVGDYTPSFSGTPVLDTSADPEFDSERFRKFIGRDEGVRSKLSVPAAILTICAILQAWGDVPTGLSFTILCTAAHHIVSGRWKDSTFLCAHAEFFINVVCKQPSRDATQADTFATYARRRGHATSEMCTRANERPSALAAAPTTYEYAASMTSLLLQAFGVQKAMFSVLSNYTDGSYTGFHATVATKHLELARFATRTQLGKVMDTLLTQYPVVVNFGPMMEEIRKVAQAAVQVTKVAGAEMIPYQGLLGLQGHELTAAREIPISGAVVIRYLRDANPQGTWSNYSFNETLAPQADVEECLRIIAASRVKYTIGADEEKGAINVYTPGPTIEEEDGDTLEKALGGGS